MEHIIISKDACSVLWAIGWLFTIGYLRLSFWKGVLALIIWPYYMGRKFIKEPALEAK
ncbi:MAG TPA: hypothetical protein VGO63_02230 [Candidatus Paceibacterota bacterium]|jgi:hypothetical protein|nr:hypothetical protein [Candidatus Paceibacterota bacterium]